MLSASIVLFQLLFVMVSASLDISSTITVALLERKPFVMINHGGKPKGLAISIVENFAKKFSHKIQYLMVNSLFASASDEHFNPEFLIK